MGLYNVVEPCMVGDLHYARPTTEPIEVDDDVAKPLVKAGCLTAVQPDVAAVTDAFADAGRQAGQEFTEGVADAEQKPEPEHRPRRPRGTAG